MTDRPPTPPPTVEQLTHILKYIRLHAKVETLRPEFQQAIDSFAAYLPALAAAEARQQELTGWRCFHCDEVFTDKTEALEHFGYESDLTSPVCRLTEDEVKEIRALEGENRQLRHDNEELGNTARLWHEAEADRVRRIGNRQWFQELDYREGEKLAFQERLAAAERLAKARQAELTRVCEQLQQALSVTHHQLAAAEQHVTELRECLASLVEANERWNSAVTKIIGRQPETGCVDYLAAAKALLARTAPSSGETK